MPQLSPMSWVLVISLVLIFLVFFAVMIWWWGSTEYSIKCDEKKNSMFRTKKNYFVVGVKKV
uniref:ATP synthase F0 subunit 8 n=1 Tax=Utterbackia imbecillis TaxID=52383 RepID=F4ZGA9_9BIVA|nr:ATP synthase F0 subunit 8 [Utterbackia imbecillis]ADL62618.1 ATP synthase F0 subunit 8 [Utterbackia imbecillis]